MPPTATLPGISFASVARPLDDVLPRMDVCGFVGFASSGPVDVPVLVEDPVTYRDIFGPDPVLASHADGTPVVAHLGSAVEAFFANGGVRAWVVRAAAGDDDPDGAAVTNHLTVPGLVVPGGRDGTAGGWRVASLPARSPGTWSDELRAGASLTVASTQAISVDDDAVVVDHGVDVVVGDLLRLDVGDGLAALVAVTAVGADPGGRHVAVDREGGWLVTEGSGAIPSGAAWRLTTGEPVPVDVSVESTGEGAVVAVDPASPVAAGDTVAFEAAAPSDHALTLVTLGDEVLDPSQPADGLRRHVVTTASTLAPLPAGWGGQGQSPPTAPVIVEVQRLRLTVTRGGEVVAELDHLGATPAHHRALTHLPDDRSLFSLLAGLPRPAPAGGGISVDELAQRPLTPLERACLTPRFPLAGPPAAALLPLGLGTDPSAVTAGPAPDEIGLAPAPVRNGLGSFDAGLFVDPALAGLGVDTVVPTAWELVYLQDRPRRLRGMHALVTNEDITLLCIPDAVHPGWDRRAVLPPTPLTAPVLAVLDVDGHRVDLGWDPVDGADAYDVEHDAAPSFDDPRRTTVEGAGAAVDAPGGCPQVVHHRVRARRGVERGPWSNTVAAHVPGATFAPCALPAVPAPPPADAPPAGSAQVSWRVRTGPEAEPWLELRAVHTAALRWCASRADVLAVLTLPAEHDADAAARHVAVLRGAAPAFDPDGGSAASPFLSAGVPALSDAEADVLGFGALYHPWPVTGAPLGTLEGSGAASTAASTTTGAADDVGRTTAVGVRAVPPDGAVAGTFAQRALRRGAWVAPARRPLQRVVALSPVLAEARLLDLSLSGVNPVVLDPSGFMALTASTMSDVAALRPVNVRRLLMLLRRLVRAHGVGIVFEPNDHELRRLVHLRLERLLTSMFQRGAFAGATPGEGFELSTGDDVNPPGSLDQGRFVVELRIAPSRPLEFLTVRLVLSGNDLAAAEVGR